MICLVMWILCEIGNRLEEVKSFLFSISTIDTSLDGFNIILMIFEICLV